MRRLFITLALAVVLLVVGCTTRVPAGHIGRVLTPSGWGDEVQPTGNHACYGRDTMYMLDISEKTYCIKMSILCKDKLNFKFDLNIRCMVDSNNKELLKSAFEKLTPSGENYTIVSQQLYQTYILPVVEPIARVVVGKYKTIEIIDNRGIIQQELDEKVKEALKGNLMKVDLVTASNLDFPDVITKAQEERAIREVEIETEKAEQQKRLLVEENKYKIANLEYKRKLIEAAQIRDYNLIVGSSISDGFLAWHTIKALSQAAEGPNNWGFIIPYDAAYLKNTSKKFGELPLDKRLLDKIEEMKKASEETAIPEEEKPQQPNTQPSGK